MRIAICALSAVLLSGCSWLGMGGNGHHGAKQAANGYYGAKHSGQYGQQARQHDPCQIMAPTQPIPRGCAPHQVTLGAQNGFPQQPNFGGGQYASGGYGSHAGNAQQHAGQRAQKRGLRKPKLRGQMSLGFERSFGGSYLDRADSGNLYQASQFNQIDTTGPVPSGTGGTTTYTVNDATVVSSGSIASNDDVHATPLRISGGLEYIWTPRTTVFVNAGYSHASGENVGGFAYNGDVESTRTNQDYDAAGNPTGAPRVNPTQTYQDKRVANAEFQFSDMRRVDLEVGARHYFNPILKSSVARPISPFVGVSAGASHYNAQSAQVALEQLQYSTATNDVRFDEYEPEQIQVGIYGSQWVPSGQINAGLEWQVTPKTAMAFETGVRVEGGRKYSNGEKTNSNVAIPVTIRGSYNF